MTDQEINIAIAKACGKKACDHHPEVWERRGPEGDSELYCIRCEAYLHDMRLCDYLNDLNAIQSECRAKLRTDAEQSLFAVTLMDVVGLDPDAVTDGIEMFHYATATSRQWCIAFLRTIGKWSYG